MYDLFLTKLRVYSPDGKLIGDWKAPKVMYEHTYDKRDTHISWDDPNCDPVADIQSVISAVFQGYNPFNPNNPRPEDKVEIPERTLKLAKDAGGTHISKDGKIIYKKVFGIVQYADWDGREFGSWWDTQSDTFPSEVTEIK